MRFALRPDGTRPTRHDDDAPVFEILGTQECHNLHSMRKFKQTWSVALNAAGLPSPKITAIWDYMLDEERPMWWGDEAGPKSSTSDWTTADKPLYIEYHELTEMLHFAWTALRNHVRHPCPRAQLAGASRDPPACEQTMLYYPIETFTKVVTSGQFKMGKPRNHEASMLVACHRSNAVQMSVLGYAICSAVMTACWDDPAPKLLRLDDLADRARHAVCYEIGTLKVKPFFDSVHYDPVQVD